MRDHQQVVLTIMLDDTAAFQESLLILLTLEDTHVCPFYHVGEVRFQFHQLPCTIDDIHAPVVIEEQRAVMEVAHTGDNGPRSLCLLGGEDISVAHRPLFVGSQQCIELPVMVLQGSSPLTTSVGSTLLQVVLR